MAKAWNLIADCHAWQMSNPHPLKVWSSVVLSVKEVHSSAANRYVLCGLAQSSIEVYSFMSDKQNGLTTHLKPGCVYS